MSRFAFVIHPISLRDVSRKFPIAKVLPDPLIEQFLRLKKPSVVSEISGITSKTGATTTGVFVGLPMTPKMMMQGNLELTYDKIVACAKVAEAEGCQIIGLGAFSSVVGDGGITIANRSNIAVTTGNSYTVATAIEGTLKAAALVGIDPAQSKLAVVGATGSIGKTCAELLSKQFSSTLLIGRDLERTEQALATVERGEATVDIRRLQEAHVVVTVTSSESAIVEPEHLMPCAVVCDVSRPRDVSVRVQKERPDVLVIEGGVVRVPGEVNFGFDFGFPPKTAYACMSETMMLALEERIENFTLGKSVSSNQVEQTWEMARKHGFELAGFRSFEKEVDSASIEQFRINRQKRFASV